MVTRLASTFCAVSDSEFSTPHSRIRLPNIRKKISSADPGATNAAIIRITMGNRIFVRLLTAAGLYSSRICRSFFVVSSLMIGGWIMGTSAM